MELSRIKDVMEQLGVRVCSKQIWEPLVTRSENINSIRKLLQNPTEKTELKPKNFDPNSKNDRIRETR